MDFHLIGSINESFGVPDSANVVHIPIIREIVNHSALSNRMESTNMFRNMYDKSSAWHEPLTPLPQTRIL